MELNLQEYFLLQPELYETRNGKLFEAIYKDDEVVIALNYPIEETTEENTRLYPRVIDIDYFKKEYQLKNLPQDFRTINFKQKKMAIQLVLKQLSLVSDEVKEGSNEA
jgi:hypothetical protein